MTWRGEKVVAQIWRICEVSRAKRQYQQKNRPPI